MINTASIQAYNLAHNCSPTPAPRRDPELHQALAQRCWQEGHPGQLRGARPDLDAAHPRHHAAGEGEERSARTSPLGRAGQPAELAPSFVLLASDESSYITGEVVGVTGGNPLP